MEVFKSNTANHFKVPGKIHYTWKVFALAVTFIIINNPAKAQSIAAASIQELAFGSFATGIPGGTVEVSPMGNRTVSGSIIGLAGSPVSSAIFEIAVKGNDKLVQIQFQTDPARISRVGGTEFMTITNFKSDKPGDQFPTTKDDAVIQVNVGATLNVQGSEANPSGNYSGTFTVTFIRN